MLTLNQVAKRIVWWEKPDIAVRNRKRLILQILEYGNLDDVRTLIHTMGHKDIINALHFPLPGIMTEKSWRFWHIYYGLPIKPLPKREL